MGIGLGGNDGVDRGIGVLLPMLAALSGVVPCIRPQVFDLLTYIV